MPRALISLFLVLYSCCVIADDELARLENIDRNLQALKTEMLELSADITRLEQQLYPAANRFSVFLSVVNEAGLVLESMQLRVNGALQNSHIYDAGDNRALQGGGIQKLFEGFMVTGEHLLELVIKVKQDDGQAIEIRGSHDFVKTVTASTLEARLLSKPQAAYEISFSGM